MKVRCADVLAPISFAARKHRDQRRKDAESRPYINHSLPQAHVLAPEGGVSDIKTLIAAVLHDTVEDTETTLEDLVEEFGQFAIGTRSSLRST